MRVWIDITAPAHVLVFRPLIRILRERGDEVEITEARVIPAGEIDVQFARDEGEGFESVDDWREAHERFFERPLPPETPIVAVRFRLVERL